MGLVIGILIYMFIGYILECYLSQEPSLWGVFLWPFILIGTLVMCFVHNSKPDVYERIKNFTNDNRKGK